MALRLYRMGAIYYKICIDSYEIYLLECFTSPLTRCWLCDLLYKWFRGSHILLPLMTFVTEWKLYSQSPADVPHLIVWAKSTITCFHSSPDSINSIGIWSHPVALFWRICFDYVSYFFIHYCCICPYYCLEYWLFHLQTPRRCTLFICRASALVLLVVPLFVVDTELYFSFRLHWFDFGMHHCVVVLVKLFDICT